MGNTVSVLFIDAGVQNYHQLLAGLKLGIQVHVLAADQDGIEQITEILNHQYADVTPHTIHIVSHGSPGCLHLGNSQLSLTTLPHYTKALQTWFNPKSYGFNPKSQIPNLKPDLLLYGCNVAAGDAGEEFITKLHHLTGAEIAASTTKIGHSTLGGNWGLNYRTGNIPIAPTALVASDWVGILTDPTIDLDFVPTNSLPSDPGFTPFTFTSWIVQNDGQTEAVDGAGNGEVATYANVGSVNGQSVDLRGVVVSSNNINPTFTVDGDDANVNMSPSNPPNASAGVLTEAVIRWELVSNATGDPVNANFTILITDLDGTNRGSETIRVASDAIDAYTLENVTDISVTENNGFFTFTPGDADPGTPGRDPTNAVQLTFSNTSSFEINYIRTAAANFTFDANFIAPLFSTPVTADTNPNYATIFTEGETPVAIAANTIEIADDGQLVSATITLTNPQTDDQLNQPAAASLPGGIIVDTANSTSSVIVLTGTASVDDYETAIQAITFENTSTTPDETTTRLVNIQVTDDESIISNLAQTSIQVIDVAGAPNTPPILDLDSDNDSGAADPNSQTSFTISNGPIAIATDPSITDDGAAIIGATITLTNPQAGDVLSGASIPGGTGVTASADGTVITLSGAGTLAEYEAAIAAITFDNPTANPDTRDRTLEVVINDGAADSNIAVSTILFDGDGDGVPDSVEGVGPNGGDANGDGVADLTQSNVASVVNPVTNQYVTTEVSGTDCNDFTDANHLLESDLPVQDPDADYFLGLTDFIVTCATPGGTATIKIFWDQEYDVSSWTYRKFDGTNFFSIDDQVTYGTADVGGQTVTTVTYDITDGGFGDVDGLVNGVIVDPVGVVIEPEDDGASNTIDVITGGDGDDAIRVGRDKDDLLLGGSRGDAFTYIQASEFGEIIDGFEIVRDRIDLSPLFNGNASLGSNVTAQQIGNHTAVFAHAGSGLEQVARLLNVNADTLDNSNFIF